MNVKRILIAVVVIVILYAIIRAIFSPDPHTNIAPANEAQIVSASDLQSGDTSTSNFTYSIWFYVDDWNYKYGEPKIILGRMSAESATTPQFGLVLGAMKNDLNITVDTYPGDGSDTTPTDSTAPSSTHTCNVQNVPLQKWVHCLVSLYGKSLDVYLDGKLVRTCVLDGVAKVDSTTDVSVTPMGGFSGFTSYFQYWAAATNPQEAYNIYKKGYGGSALGNLFNKYRVRFSFLVDNKEQGSFEI